MANTLQSAAGDSRSTKPDTDSEFLTQVGAGAVLRGALLKLLEVRSEDPIGFLADHFGNLAQSLENGDSGSAVEGDKKQHQQALQSPEEQNQHAGALWHLTQAHYSQRSAFNNNVAVAFSLLSRGGRKRKPGLKGRAYTELLRRVCRDGAVAEPVSAPLIRKLRCQDHEAVPFDLFRRAVLTCFVFADFVRKSRSLFETVSPSDGSLCRAVLGSLRDALETTGCSDPARYLEASAKLTPGRLAQAMDRAQTLASGTPSTLMGQEEFIEEASALFVSRVKRVS
ncbi:tubulin polyglutamylase complex subunit 1 [Acipenser oxyrinchus oxyrinchus]|uniref:Tubulin polyglutamylase complex subunit 1 n=1 Tax=Acipenser oxyrinchus oxyrinchus TaxID=40147 RepID=A0AAD8CSS0_ACIOX|nr:tubulin polyglutamylase complex subunit 1 [Acipenser oxyrinchus oxyrinchus]